MASFSIKNIELVWRGITLTGFASSKVEVGQSEAASVTTIYGLAGESLNVPNPKRAWTIKSSFHAFSVSYPILEQDNLNHVEDTLIVRDLNSGTTDTFTKCVITSIGNKRDGGERLVTWSAPLRNSR